jgi:hypothetical protein
MISPGGKKETLMSLFHIILMVAAFICFLLSAIGVSMPRGNIMGAGLACWVLAELLGLAR